MSTSAVRGWRAPNARRSVLLLLIAVLAAGLIVGPPGSSRRDTADMIVAAGISEPPGANPMNIPCHGDGKSGNRIAFYYAYLPGRPNRIAQLRAGLVRAIKIANGIVEYSARETHGNRYLRVRTTSRCVPTIVPIRLSSSGGGDFTTMIAELKNRGLTSTSRKYVVFVDAHRYCGIGTLDEDDRPGPDNASNTGPSYARVDTECFNGPTVAHEIFHMLGAVQNSAPDHDGTGHCDDEYDLMCYDAGGKHMRSVCHRRTVELRLDCGNNDYFNTNPRRGNYLARHWNTANSAFLYGGGPVYPRAPSGVRYAHATLTGANSATVRWAAPAKRGTGRLHYSVYRNGTRLWSGTGRRYRDRHLPADQASHYRITAYTAGGSGPSTNRVHVHAAAPSAPGSLRSTGTSPTVVSWSRARGIVSGYVVLLRNQAGEFAKWQVLPASARSVTDSTWTLSRWWSGYQVCAYNVGGQRCSTVYWR